MTATGFTSWSISCCKERKNNGENRGILIKYKMEIADALNYKR